MASEHGHTPAAWTAVAIMFLGVMVGAVAVVIANIPLLFVGLAIIALGGITGGVMSMMGLGQNAGSRTAHGDQERKVTSS
jgi:hypothetical protein